MRGHIYTSYGSFFIQPIEEYTNENPNILHKISRENISAKVHHLQQNNDIQESQCGTCHNHKDCNNHSTEDILSSDETRSEHQNSINNDNNDNNNNNNNNNSNNNNSHNRNKRDITPHVINNSAYTMEVLVAVDRKMQEYHGSNIKAYVLTLMSIVSSVYSDASIGNSINIAVVHILLLKDDLNVQSNHIGVSASQMLSGFCKFIKQYKFKTHHDTALLLTREQICRSANQMKCDTLGLAELGTMCRPSSCAIVQDNGLSAAFTIAHELGHVLSMPHDDDIKCAKFRKPGKNQQNIMSRMLDHDTHPWSWSDCSRHYVTEYLENNYGICMLDKPIHDMIEPTSGQLLAGEKFSANQQCELVFGSGSKVCSYMPTCSRLWCGNDAEGCRTQHMPWADGTECAVNSWCQRGKCVHRNREALVKIDGAWGSWKQYGECSRHCGGGIQSAIRDCNSPSPANGGKYCIGNRIRYRSCNTHDCSKNSVDFREEQCSEYNNNNYDIPGLDKNVKWVPKYGASPKEECKLYCRVENTNNYFVLNEKVKDGTSCTRDSFDKCVNGICRAAGCDNELDSLATLDKCGVCKGKNNTCYDISGKISGRELEYNKQYSKKPYYYYVIQIMKGASNIDIIQKGYPNDYNYIALMDDNGDYILNGYNVVTQYPRTFPYGGVIFEYTGTNDTNERVTSTYARKLTKDLTVEILSRNDYYDIDNILEYSFTMQNYTIYNFEPYNEKQQQLHHHHHHTNQQQQPPHNSHNNQQTSQHNVNVYQWQMSEWNDCDQICEGNRFRTPACIMIEIGTKVSPNYCHNIKKPLDEYQVCNTNCNVRWEITRSECTSDCGEGVIKVKHNCVQTFMQTGKSMYVDEKYCPGTAKPLTYEKCLGPCRLAAWIYENWGPCSRTCGGGTQTRTASCASDPSGNYYIEESYCLQLAKEDLIRACNQDECPRWSYGDETACSVTCGTGIRRTTIVCKQNNNIVETNLCNNYPRPETKILNCTMDPCYRSIKIAQSIPFLYVDDIPQTATRSPYLINSNTNNNNNNNHNSNNSPPTTSPRNYFNTGYKWRTSRWGPCSVSCGGGQRLRSVRCGNITSGKHELVDDRYCSDDRPTNVTNCDSPCPVWHYSAWSECQSDCKRQRQVICHDKLRMIDKKSCNPAEEPHSHETCCHFRWRNMWTPCNVTCGIGVRRRQRVCMRLYPKSDKNPHPRKKGQSVDYQYCSHMKQPPFYPKQKACRKQCDVPKWDVTSWSKCSVGCGQGYATRDVRCMLGKQLVNETNCFATQKPIKTRHCESNSECKWKTGPWKNCSCGGFTKRRIQCYDSKLNKLSNSCNERIKPIKRKKCPQPANCSCKGIKTIDGKTTDGEYEMNVRGRKVKIYCHNMKSELPQEFLTLPDYQENFSTYFGQRSKDSNQCPTSRSGEWHDSSIPAGVTYFSKIRINLHTLQIVEDDLEFSHTTGRPQTFASAGDCYSTTRQCPRGEFSINFTGTKFRIKPQTLWDIKGQNSTMIFRYKLEPPFNRVRASCGGYCGGCFPSKSTTLQLEIL